MSLRFTIGIIIAAIAGLYLFVVPMVNPASPHAYVPEFMVAGLAGILYMYLGRNDKPSKSP